jgi:hypothetical protein
MMMTSTSRSQCSLVAVPMVFVPGVKGVCQIYSKIDVARAVKNSRTTLG